MTKKSVSDLKKNLHEFSKLAGRPVRLRLVELSDRDQFERLAQEGANISPARANAAMDWAFGDDPKAVQFYRELGSDDVNRSAIKLVGLVGLTKGSAAAARLAQELADQNRKSLRHRSKAFISLITMFLQRVENSQMLPRNEAYRSTWISSEPYRNEPTEREQEHAWEYVKRYIRELLDQVDQTEFSDPDEFKQYIADKVNDQLADDDLPGFNDADIIAEIDRMMSVQESLGKFDWVGGFGNQNENTLETDRVNRPHGMNRKGMTENASVGAVGAGAVGSTPGRGKSKLFAGSGIRRETAGTIGGNTNATLQTVAGQEDKSGGVAGDVIGDATVAIQNRVNEKHIGFDKLKNKLAHKKGVHDAGALAAAIGRKKYGAKKMANAAAQGHAVSEADLNRRSFLKGAGATAVGTATAAGLNADPAPIKPTPPVAPDRNFAVRLYQSARQFQIEHPEGDMNEWAQIAIRKLSRDDPQPVMKQHGPDRKQMQLDLIRALMDCFEENPEITLGEWLAYNGLRESKDPKKRKVAHRA